MTEIGSVSQLAKYSVLVRRCFGDRLQDVPLLDDVAVPVYAEDADADVLMVAGPDLVTMLNHIVALGECALELDAPGYSAAMRST
jgi:hypothetical protein